MKKEEFIMEALKKLTPDTEWHGEAYADEKVLANLDILESMLDYLLGNLFYGSIDFEGVTSSSYKAISKRKREIINYLNDEYFKEE